MKSHNPTFLRQFAPLHWLAVMVAALLLAACQPIAPVQPAALDAIPEVTIAVSDTEFTIPSDFPGGIVALTVQNNSSLDLDVSISRVREGSSAEELLALGENFMENIVPIMEKASFITSFNPIPVGQSSRVIIDFRTGEFVVDATEHSEEGPMPGAEFIVGTFTTTEMVGTLEPQADVTIDMNDFAFTMPDEIAAGKQLWGFTNSGQQWHMMFGVKPNADASMDEVMAALMEEGEPAGPPPFEFVSELGIPPMSEGERVWMEYDIAPGTYIMVCPLPDVAAMMAGEMPMSHLHHGMHRTLIVKGDTAATVPSTLPQVTITAHDDAFEMPTEIAAGWVDIAFANAGTINHHGYVVRLQEGVTMDDVIATLTAEMEGATGEDSSTLYDLGFFLPDTDPGTSNQATVELAPGTWMIVSFSMDTADGEGPPMPDWAKGLIQQFTVVAAPGEAPAVPTADVVVTIQADDFEMPAELPAGEQTLQIVNNTGNPEAYAFIVKLGDDTTVEDVLAAFEAMFSGQPLAEEELPVISTVGGLMGHNLNDSYYTTINLEAGNYAIISSIGSVDFPYSGLYKNFTVK